MEKMVHHDYNMVKPSSAVGTKKKKQVSEEESINKGFVTDRTLKKEDLTTGK
jgi:hypothetical protein